MNRPFTRRAFLLGGAAAAAAVSLPIATAHDTTGVVELVSKRIPIRNLPSAFDGYRIGFITDSHVGANVPFDWTEEALELVTKAGIDLLLLGGDFIAVNDSFVSQTLQQMRNQKLAPFSQYEYPARVYNGIAELVQRYHPKDGTFSVFGNHDRWISPSICTTAFNRCGLPFLNNETRKIRRGEATLTLMGTDDYWNGIPSIDRFPPPAGTGKELRVLLTHNPDFASLMLRKGVLKFDLSLSGHTHGGQIKLPGIGALFYNIQDLRLAEGLYTAPDATQCYTSRGIGVVEIPYRVNCPAEATVLELHRA